ncbi:MAG: hypothetical protein IKA22_08905 [Lentisphaeria bacterium]|nr:hypothetical protein [Lentisphaeria bacterium]
MKKVFNSSAPWKHTLPIPVCDFHLGWDEFHNIAWQYAHDHMLDRPGLPQTPYMDEALCDTRIWIWDTCFMSMYCRYASLSFPGVESLDNFYKPIHDKSPMPYLVAQKPASWERVKAGDYTQMLIHIADNPPLFAWAELENARMSGDCERIRHALPYLEKHYHWLESFTEVTDLGRPDIFFKVNFFKDKSGKGYHWHPDCSGLDNSPRGRVGKAAPGIYRTINPKMLFVDAISQQALSARCISELHAILGNNSESAEWRKEFERQSDLINRHYFDEKDGCYYDIDCETGEFLKVLTPASFWPLIAGVATPSHAEAMVKFLLDPQKLGGNIPIPSLSHDDIDFNHETGEYAKGGVWLELAYFVIKGLDYCKYYELASELASKLIQHMHTTYLQYEPHTIWECYNPYRPEPSTENSRQARADFCGWSALGPISLFIEDVIGLRDYDAFNKVITWIPPKKTEGMFGIKNLYFAGMTVSLLCDGKNIYVTSSGEFTLKFNDKTFSVKCGTQSF